MNSVIVACAHCGTKNRIPADRQHLGPRCGKCGQGIDMTRSAVPVELHDNSFNAFLSRADLPVMVDFFSPTCGPCRMLAPVIDTLASRYFGRAIIAKLDTSRNSSTASRFGIRGVPTLLFFKDGLLADQVTGAVPEQTLAVKLDALL